MPPGGGELPEVDEALRAQGATGVRALDLLRDARRVLAGAGLERLAEVAESCLRGAADALLSLPGVPDAVGLKSAAKGLLAAVDTLPECAVGGGRGAARPGGPPGRLPPGAGGGDR